MRARLSLSLISILWASAAQAAAPPSPYQALQDMFQHGTLPTQAELTGWFTGRCSVQVMPTEPVGAMLAGALVPEGKDFGPAFPRPMSFRFVMLLDQNGHSTYFDQLSESDQKDTEALVDAAWANFTPVTEKEGSLTATTETDMGQKTWWVRKSGRYLVASSTSTSGRDVNYCYFFKKTR